MLLPPLQTHPTTWTPAAPDFKVTLNIALEGSIVPTQCGAARVDYSRLLVLDNFIDEATREQLFEFLTEPGWAGASPPDSKWERCTADAADRPRTWGLHSSVLQDLAASQLPARLELQSRLSLLYPEAVIAHMPSDQIQAAAHKPQPLPSQQQQQQGKQQQQQQGHQERQHWEGNDDDDSGQHQHQQQPFVDCSCFLANAAVHGDAFSWHIDADPACFPSPSPWTAQYGTYCNREPGKPLFVSLLLYLDTKWPLDSNAETLFLDSMTDTGLFVRPKPYRAVLFDQDIAHRLSQPSPAAGRPRYSLVMKLVMLPKEPQRRFSIARPEWGRPTYFGSAGHVERAARAAAEAGEAAEAAAAAEAGQRRPGGAVGRKRAAEDPILPTGDAAQQKQQQQQQQE